MRRGVAPAKCPGKNVLSRLTAVSNIVTFARWGPGDSLVPRSAHKTPAAAKTAAPHSVIGTFEAVGGPSAAPVVSIRPAIACIIASVYGTLA